MALVSVICTNCRGAGRITCEGGSTYMVYAPKLTCDECEGTGSILVHTGQIGVDHSVIPDETWKTVWERQDDHTLDVLDMFRLGEPK